MVYARIELDEYTKKVLNVIKAKFDLRDKSEAIRKFAEMYGGEFVEKEANDKYIKKVLEISDRHIRKYGNRKMTLKELDNLCEV